MTELNIASRFSPYLGGRYKNDGPGSGEEFRDHILVHAVQDAMTSGERLTVTLDGVAGVPSSFLEEAFGGLLRVRKDWTLEAIKAALVIDTSDPELLPFVKLAYEYMAEESRRQGKR